MTITKEMIETVQLGLNNLYHHNLTIDGDAGKNTMNALAQINTIPIHWNKNRKLIGFLQYYCDKESIDAGPIDGYWGPQTDTGYDSLIEKIKTGNIKPWRDDEGIGGSPVSLSGIPLQTQDELVKYYGNVGTNQTIVTVPYPLKLAWNTSKIISSFSCHETVADSLVRVLDRVQDWYKDDISALGLDMWGGCFNVRKMRGGTSWSTHSWGIALDWDPANNRLKFGRDKAKLAQPQYDMWWKLWHEEKWTSLGIKRNYDWMHVQRARVR